MALSINRKAAIFILRLVLNITGLYLVSLSTSRSPSAMHPVELQLCVIHLLPISPTHTSVDLLQIPTCCGLMPSPGRYLAPAEVVCVLNSSLSLPVTSVVMSCCCEQHLLSSFLFLNKPRLRFKPRDPFGHQKLLRQKYSFCLICR